MAFFRRITRERTLNSLEDFETNDNGLRSSISRFMKTERYSKVFDSFQIHEDWYAERSLSRRQQDCERSENIRFKKFQGRLLDEMSLKSNSDMSMSRWSSLRETDSDSDSKSRIVKEEKRYHEETDESDRDDVDDDEVDELYAPTDSSRGQLTYSTSSDKKSRCLFMENRNSNGIRKLETYPYRDYYYR